MTSNDELSRITGTATGIVTGITVCETAPGTPGYFVPLDFKQRTKDLAHECGLGVQFFALEGQEETPIGAIARVPRNDRNGHLKGFLKSVCKDFQQGGALYCTSSLSTWQILHSDGQSSGSSHGALPHRTLEDLSSLVRLLTSLNRECPLPACRSSSLVSLRLERVRIIEEPNGWLGKWRLSLTRS